MKKPWLKLIMRRNKSIIYINFAPYENAGRILDFLLDNFQLVLVFSFDFHKLNQPTQSNYLKIFSEGKEIKEVKLFRLPTPEALLFISLPFIATVIAIQTMWYITKLRVKFGKFDIFLTVNAFTAWVGNILRDLSIIDKTIFWVWDYYPPGYPHWIIRLARWAYWQFDKLSTRSSDSTVFLNKKLINLRKQIGVLSKTKKYSIVPIGTNLGRVIINKNKYIIGHLGVLKRSQGLDLLFDNLKALEKIIPNLEIEIIGSGPDAKYFKSRARQMTKSNIKFYGFIKEDDKVDKIIRHWSIGLAPYIPDMSSPAYWTDPSKIKAYISQGVPVITTSITPFSEEIKERNAGIVIDFFDRREFIEAVSKILKHQKDFKNNAFSFAKNYYYKKIYPRLFEVVE